MKSPSQMEFVSGSERGCASRSETGYISCSETGSAWGSEMEDAEVSQNVTEPSRTARRLVKKIPQPCYSSLSMEILGLEGKRVNRGQCEPCKKGQFAFASNFAWSRNPYPENTKGGPSASLLGKGTKLMAAKPLRFLRGSRNPRNS